MASPSQSKGVSTGFGAIGIVIAAAVVLIIGALGYVFYQRMNQQPATTTAANTAVTAQPGTADSIDQLTQQDAATEANVDSSADTEATQDSTSADSTVNTVGSAYDENSF